MIRAMMRPMSGTSSRARIEQGMNRDKDAMSPLGIVCIALGRQWTVGNDTRPKVGSENRDEHP